MSVAGIRASAWSGFFFRGVDRDYEIDFRDDEPDGRPPGPCQ